MKVPLTAVSSLILLCSSVLIAQQAPDSSRYLDQLQVRREENWFQRELRKFSTYPHLVRSYQLIDQGRLQEARLELEKYLAIDPHDLQVRLNYIMVLHRLKDFSESIRQANIILEAKPGFVPALLYRGMARQSLGQVEEAIADFKVVSIAAETQPPDRIFAYNMIADLAIRQKNYHLALGALDSLDGARKEFANYYRRGIVHEGLGELQQSDIAFRAALQFAKSPADRAQALRGIGLVAEKRQDFNSAKQALQSALKLSPADTELKRYLAQVTYELAFRRKMYGESLAALATIGSADFDILWKRAAALEQERRLPEAEAAYRSALSLASAPEERLKAYRSLGEIARKLGDAERAEQFFLQALRLSPQNRDLLRGMAEAAYDRKDYAEAIRWNRELVASSPTPTTREFLANLLYAVKDYQAAAAEYLRILNQVEDPKDRHRIYMSLGNTYTNLGKFDQASEAFRQASRIRRDETTLAAAAEAVERQGRIKEAIELRAELLREKPDAQGHYKLGVLYAQAGDSLKAIEQLDQSVRGDLPAPLRAVAYKEQGFQYRKLGRYADARRAFENSLSLNPSDPTLYFSLGEVSIQQGAYQDAVRFLERGLSIQETTAGLKTLALAQEKAGNVDRAIEIYERLLAGVPEHSETARELQINIANLKLKRGSQIASLNFRRGEYSDAAVRFLEAFDRNRSSNWPVLMQAAESLALAERWEMAAQVNQFLLGLQNLPPERRGEVFEKLAFAQNKLGQYPQAVDSFRKAIDWGREGSRIRQNLGLVLYQLKRWPEALEEFKASVQSEETPANLVYLARTYKEVGKPGLAIHYMDQALQSADRLEVEDRTDLYSELGYLLAAEGEHQRAAEVWSKSVALKRDPMIMLGLARMYRLSGDLTHAEKLLSDTALEKLPTHLQAERFEEVAYIRSTQGNLENALGALAQANALEPSASRYYQSALLLRRLDRTDEATRNLEKAYSMDPTNPEYLVSLAYAYKEVKRLREAAGLFEKAAKRDPYNAALYRELGYSEMRENNNTQAVTWLKKAIDVELQNASKPLPPNLKVEVYAIRREVSRLTHRYDLISYLAYRSSSIAQGTAPSVFAGGILPSQGGLEFSYQPPRFGFRDERIFQMFGRLLWNVKPDTLTFDRSSYQGGIGFRYKPLRAENLYLSAERIFRIGSRAEDHWLFRGFYSWDYGYDLKPNRKFWDYTFVYGDSGFFADRPRTLAYFVEGRQGVTWRLGESLLLSPHLILDTRYQNPRALNAAYIEGGGGISLRYLFNETRYEAPRSSSEILIHHKNGLFFRNPGSLENNFGGWVITGVFHF